MTSHSASPTTKPTRRPLGSIPDLPTWLTIETNIYAGRDCGTLKDIGLGNPFRLTCFSRSEALKLYKDHCIPRILGNADLMKRLRSATELSCSCSLDKRCHVDELLKIV